MCIEPEQTSQDSPHPPIAPAIAQEKPKKRLITAPPPLCDPLLLAKECADRLRIHPETFRRWLRAGRIRNPKKMGRGWRIAKSELERLERDELTLN